NQYHGIRGTMPVPSATYEERRRLLANAPAKCQISFLTLLSNPSDSREHGFIPLGNLVPEREVVHDLLPAYTAQLHEEIVTVIHNVDHQPLHLCVAKPGKPIPLNFPMGRD